MRERNTDNPNKIAGYAEAIEQATKISETALLRALQTENETGQMDDSLVIPGLAISAVVLTALAAELILKAWIGKLKGKYPSTHNLDALLNDLDCQAWNFFEKSEIDIIRSTFRKHSDDFTHWRYLFENVRKDDTTKNPDPLMKESVRILIGKYRLHMMHLPDYERSSSSSTNPARFRTTF